MKNNVKTYLLLLFLTFLTGGCEKQILDKKPMDIISDADVWNDPNLIKAYVTNLYSKAPFIGVFVESFWSNWSSGEWETAATELAISDEGTLNYNWMYPLSIQGLLDGSGGEIEYWDYNLIRSINEFLVKIETGKVTDDVKQQYKAEVRFLRAYVYFEMVERYGGVPIILVPQNVNAGDALYVPRNTEKEVYDLIASECDAVSTILPDAYPAAEVGRVTKFAALALKSRAMLFAASIAKYGTVQLNGTLGFPSSDADGYWQASLNASKAIMDAHQFELYNQYPTDKAKNYQMLFLDKNNSEIILAKKYVSKTYGNSVDDFFNPNFNYTNAGCVFSPSMDLVNSFEMKDGSSGVIDWANISGPQTEIFKNKDPRFEASVLYNGQQWAWDTVRIWYGIYTETGDFKNSETELYKGMDEVGRDEKTGQGPKSGFLFKKFLDPTRKYPLQGDSDQDWIVFRFGEILLNFAEASFELGHTSDALDAVNLIRERAGIAPLASITLDQIRHERRIELVFETQRHWDLKRWRIAATVMSGDLKGAFPYYHFDTNRWEYTIANCEPFTRVFHPWYYYYPIGNKRINNDPKLVENPGYN